MPWTRYFYPDSMKNLDEGVRVRAIRIANALMDKGYEKGKALAIAIDRARKLQHKK